MTVRGKLVTRGTAQFADYVLYAQPNANIPLAILEAKDDNHGAGDGMQQGLRYADMLDVLFVSSSNGDGFIQHDRTGRDAKVEEELSPLVRRFHSRALAPRTAARPRSMHPVPPRGGVR